ncbi:MAG: DUF177 domain-containing protein [Thermodesulfobacteriota bacterium]
MILNIEDIPISGLDIKQTLDQDWLKDTLRDIRETGECRFSAPISFDLKVTRSGRNVFVHGNISTNFVMKCSRCLKDFDCPIIISNFKYTFCPAEDKEVGDDLELSSEDLEFSFYIGEEINISQVILEQVILAIPFKPLCHDLCRGLCYKCGMDLNKEVCKCSKENKFNIGFSKLRDLKVESIK